MMAGMVESPSSPRDPGCTADSRAIQTSVGTNWSLVMWRDLLKPARDMWLERRQVMDVVSVPHTIPAQTQGSDRTFQGLSNTGEETVRYGLSTRSGARHAGSG